MSNWIASSGKSASFRREWRPCAAFCVALLVLTVLAMVSVLACELPRNVAWPSAVIAGVYGVYRAVREFRRNRVAFVIPGGAGTPSADGHPIQQLRLDWRGSFVVVAWTLRNGAVHRRLWTPLTLPTGARRELRLAVGDFNASRTRAAMAP